MSKSGNRVRLELIFILPSSSPTLLILQPLFCLFSGILNNIILLLVNTFNPIFKILELRMTLERFWKRIRNQHNQISLMRNHLKKFRDPQKLTPNIRPLTLIGKSWKAHPKIFPKFQFSGSWHRPISGKRVQYFFDISISGAWAGRSWTY